MRKICLIATILTLGLITSPGNAQTITERGRSLYELQCGECHRDSLHKRSRPAARNYDDVRAWVMHWNKEIGARWEEDDINAVAQYLNERFYHYPCPASSC